MEPKLNFLIICENAFLSDESKNLNLINVFDTIIADNFPIKYPGKFSIVAKLETTDVDHKIKLTIQNSQEKITETLAEFKGGKHQWINNFFNLTFKTDGIYTIALSLDGRAIGSTTLTLTRP